MAAIKSKSPLITKTSAYEKTLTNTILSAIFFTVIAQVDPNNQVNVYFKTGVTRIPPADTAANITSANVLNLLNAYRIPTSNVVPAFPIFNEADTVIPEIGEGSRQMDRAKVFTITLTLTDSTNKTNFLNSLSALSEVLFADLNGNTIGDLTPNDPKYSVQWGLKNIDNPGHDIHAEGAWDIFTGTPNSIIAILDNGVDKSHSDLSTKIVGGDVGFNLETDPSGTQVSHGTCMAGIAAAITNNSTGVAGVDWQAKILPKRINGKKDNGKPFSDADVTQGIIDAVNFSSYVWTLNNSWGTSKGNDQYGYPIPGRYSILIRSAFAYAYRNNRTSVASM